MAERSERVVEHREIRKFGMFWVERVVLLDPNSGVELCVAYRELRPESAVQNTATARANSGLPGDGAALAYTNCVDATAWR